MGRDAMLLSRAIRAQHEARTTRRSRRPRISVLARVFRALRSPSCLRGRTAMNILISAEAIQKRVQEMALEIARDHPDGVHMIAVLKGAFVFLSDLARALPGRCSLDFMAVSSYGASTSSSGQVQLLKD